MVSQYQGKSSSVGGVHKETSPSKTSPWRHIFIEETLSTTGHSVTRTRVGGSLGGVHEREVPESSRKVYDQESSTRKDLILIVLGEVKGLSIRYITMTCIHVWGKEDQSINLSQLFSHLNLWEPMSTQSLAAMPSGYLQHGCYPVVDQGSQHESTHFSWWMANYISYMLPWSICFHHMHGYKYKQAGILSNSM